MISPKAMTLDNDIDVKCGRSIAFPLLRVVRPHHGPVPAKLFVVDVVVAVVAVVAVVVVVVICFAVRAFSAPA